ncbi:MAG: META domain-containing protein, partial [Pseudoxanthomonas sp.]
ILALPLAIAACTKPPQSESVVPTTATATAPAAVNPAKPAAEAAFASRHWRLTDATDANGQRIEALFANVDKPLQLDFSEGRASISNTCNGMGGSYTVQGAQLAFGPMVSTKRACVDRKLLALDQEAGKRLQGSMTFVETGDTLTLTSAAGDVLAFKGEPTAESRYDGPAKTVFLEVAAQTRAHHGTGLDRRLTTQVLVTESCQARRTSSSLSSSDNASNGISRHRLRRKPRAKVNGSPCSSTTRVPVTNLPMVRPKTPSINV